MMRTTLAAVALAALPALAKAQPLPPAPNRADRAQDRRELRDDRRDLLEAQALLARWEDARARRDRRALAAAEDDVLRALDRELREARAELGRSRGEAWHDRGDPREWRDGRRDARDDLRDLARVSAIRDQLWSLRARADRRALDRKHGLLEELVQIARGELREDRLERREDRREYAGRW
jgi:hypothetical protein